MAFYQSHTIAMLAFSVAFSLGAGNRSFAQQIAIECTWREKFDTMSNQTSAHTGSASYIVELDGAQGGRMKRIGLELVFELKATSEVFTARADHSPDVYRISEFVRIDRLTGDIEAWSLTGEAGGRFRGSCRMP